MRRFYSLSFLLILIFCVLQTRAQNLSNKGKEFWTGWGHNVLSAGTAATDTKLAIYLSADQVSTISIAIPGSVSFATINDVIPAGVVKTYLIPATSGAFLSSEGLSDKGIKITSDVPIAAYAHQYGSQSSGATMLMPVETFGYNYYSLNYTQRSNQNSPNPAYSWFFIVASEDNTRVEITPSAITQSGRPAGTPFTANLSRGQIYNVFGRNNGGSTGITLGEDLTGSKIASVPGGDGKCHPIAVFSGASRIVICSSSGGDMIQQQIFPASAWGTQYLTAPTITAGNVNTNYINIYRVAVRDPSTIVKRNGVQLTGLLNNFYYEFSSAAPEYIDADKPVLVAQFMPSQSSCSGYSTSNGDPEMFFLSPVEQAINKATFYNTDKEAPGIVNFTYVNVVLPSNGISSLRIDGSATFDRVFLHPQNSNYRVVIKKLSAPSQHTIVCDSAFTAITYGMNGAESYGYNAGTLVNNLDAVPAIQNTLSQTGAAASYTCPNAPFSFSIRLTYKPTQLVWRFSQVPKISPSADTTLLNPVAVDSFFANNRRYYEYRLPNTYRFSDTGTYNIPIAVTSPQIDNCNNTVIVTYPVKVNPGPRPDFTFNYTGCKSDTAYLFGTFIPTGYNVTRYRWFYEDGTTDTLQNSKTVFPTQGTHNVRLQVIADNGCLGDSVKPVVTSPPPVASFGMTPAQSCGPATVTFTDTSSYAGGAIQSWYWDFGNGNATTVTNNSPQTQSYTPGKYTIKHFAQSGTCRGDTSIRVLTINTIPVVNFAFTTGCLQDSTVQFSDSTKNADSSALTYSWNFGDANANASNPNTSTQKDPVHKYSAYGTYQVTLTVLTANGCTAILTKPYTVNGFAPAINYNVANENTLCAQSLISLTNQMDVVNDSVRKIEIYWDLAINPTTFDTDNLPTANEVYTHQYASFTSPATKTFIIKWVVYSRGGCVSEKTKTITLYASPAVTFATLPGVCINAATIALDTLAKVTNGIAGAGVYSGPGVLGTKFNPSIAGVGMHAIKYVFTTAFGCKDSATSSIVVSQKPVVKWGFANLCDSTQFRDSSSITPGIIDTWNWTFGDNTAAVKTHSVPFNKKYTASGSYNASLFVVSDQGCSSDTLQKAIAITPLPVPSFTVQNETALCAKDSVRLTTTTNAGSDTITKLEIYWDYANQPTLFTSYNSPAAGAKYAFKYPSFTSPATKDVVVRWVIFSRGGCVTETTKTITLNALPTLQFAPLAGICLNATPLSLTGLASASNGVAGNGVFSGTGVAGNVFNPAVAGVGQHTIKYVFTSSGGCVDSLSQQIRVFPKPFAGFKNSNVCVNDSTLFSDSSSIASGVITTWNWTFGDGTTSNTKPPFRKLYTTFGDYNTGLTVVSDSGCSSDPYNKVVKVNAQPVANFSMPAFVCLPGAVQFTNLTTLPNGSLSDLSYIWSFNDPNSTAALNTSTAVNPSHIYRDSASYSIKLTATSTAGCFKDTIKTFDAFYPKPTADFIIPAIAICQGTESIFSDTSIAPGSTISQWLWSFGDGTTSTDENPAKTYTSAGLFDIRLTIKTPQGCTSDTTKQVKVYLQPKVDAGPNVFLPEGTVYQMQPVVNDTTLRFLWTPAIYLSNDTLLRPTLKPEFNQEYRLTATGDGNCVGYDSVKITVLKNLHVPNAFSPNGDAINDTWSVPYLIDYPNNVVEVYDRYGQSVYRSEGYSKPWDGKVNGKTLPVGVYYYIIDLKQPGYGHITGYITLLK
jgi:gliding motility-associated-like protein